MMAMTRTKAIMVAEGSTIVSLWEILSLSGRLCGGREREPKKLQEASAELQLVPYTVKNKYQLNIKFIYIR